VKWYSIECPQCKWKAPMVEEHVASAFRKQKWCWNCAEAKREPVEFEIRERLTSTGRLTP